MFISQLGLLFFVTFLGTLFVFLSNTRWNEWFDAIKHVYSLVSDVVTAKKVKINLKAVCEFFKIPFLTSEDYLFISEYISDDPSFLCFGCVTRGTTH